MQIAPAGHASRKEPMGPMRADEGIGAELDWHGARKTSNAMKNPYNLKGRRIAVLATHGFEQSELLEPVEALQESGAVVDIISPDGEEIRGWHEDNWGQSVACDAALSDSDADDYDAVLLPGGVMNSDKLRSLTEARKFVADFFNEGKPVFVICHGAQILIDCELVEGRKMTSHASIAPDLLNAGADWRDREVVVDDGLVTSRSPDDLPAFCARICKELDLLEAS